MISLGKGRKKWLSAGERREEWLPAGERRKEWLLAGKRSGKYWRNFRILNLDYKLQNCFIQIEGSCKTHLDCGWEGCCSSGVCQSCSGHVLASGFLQGKGGKNGFLQGWLIDWLVSMKN